MTNDNGQAMTAPSSRKGATLATTTYSRRLIAPAVGVGSAGYIRVRYRRHHGLDLHLIVALDRSFGRTAVRLAPHEGHLGAGRRIALIEHGQREHLAFIGAVAD